MHRIATDLQSAAEGYMSLASHINKLNPYELPQVIAQIPPPPIDVPMPIRKALTIDGKDKVVNHLQIYSALKGKRNPEDHSTDKRENKQGNWKQLHHILGWKLNKL